MHRGYARDDGYGWDFCGGVSDLRHFPEFQDRRQGPKEHVCSPPLSVLQLEEQHAYFRCFWPPRDDGEANALKDGKGREKRSSDSCACPGAPRACKGDTAGRNA